MKKLKIVQIHNYYRQTGGENMYFDRLVSLLKLNHHIELQSITTGTYNDIPKNSQHIEAFDSLFFTSKFITKARSLLHLFKPDIVHIHNTVPFIGSDIYHLCHTLHIPVVQTVHNFRYLCPKGVLYRNGKICHDCIKHPSLFPSILHACYHRSFVDSTAFAVSQHLKNSKITTINSLINHYIFPTEFARNFIQQKAEISKEKTSTLYYFVNEIAASTSSISDVVKQIPHRFSHYLLYCGRISEEKGLDDILPAIINTNKIILILVGNGPLYTHFVNKYQSERIVFLGEQSEKSVYYLMKHAVATLIPSKFYETGPMVLAESYANHTPVITRNIGTFPEQVNHGKSGFIFSNPSEINKYYNQLIYTSFRKSLGETAYSLYQRKYNSKVHERNLIKLYKQICAI